MDRFVVLFIGCLVVAWLVDGFDCAIVLSFLAMPGLCCFLRVTLSYIYIVFQACVQNLP